MSVTDQRINKNASVAKQTIDASVTTLTASATTTVYSTKPGYKYQILKVEVFCAGTVSNTTVDVQIGSTSVLTGVITPVSGSIVLGTLSGTLATIRGSATAALNVKTICLGSPTCPNLSVTVTLRPYPLNGEV